MHRVLPLVLLFASFLLLGAKCAAPPKALAPVAGQREFDAPGRVAVPGGTVNVAGGDLQIVRGDLSLDTRIGTYELGAVWSSARATWHATWDVSLRDGQFVDERGSVHQTAGLAGGQAIAGTHWVFLAATAVRTKGGLLYEFGIDGGLEAIRFADRAWPRISFARALVAGEQRVVALEQCNAPGACEALFSFSHDALGRVVAVDDRAGRRAEYVWDTAGRLVAARDGLDVARGWPGAVYGYGPGGQLANVTTSDGLRFEYETDAAARLVRATALGEGDPSVEFVYAAASAGSYRTDVTRADGVLMRFEYDGQRRIVAIELPALAERTSLNWAGRRPASVTRPSGGTTLYTTSEDDVVEITEPTGRRTQFVYAEGAVDPFEPFARPLASASDDLGTLETRTYGPAGRLASRANGAGDTTSYGWGALGELSSVTDPAGLLTLYEEHGEHGHPARRVIGDLIAVFSYDAVGNQLSGPDGGGRLGAGQGGVVARRFDEDRNVSAIELADTQLTGDSARFSDVSIERAADGRMLAIRRPYGGDTEWVFDALGRVVERRDRVDGAFAVTALEWDAGGRPIALARPNGAREQWTWDPAGRATSHAAFRDGVLESWATFRWSDARLVEVLDSAQAGSETYDYDAADRIVRIVHPQGETTEFDWDVRSRLIARRHDDATGAGVLSLQFAYDAADRRVATWADGALVSSYDYAAGRRERIVYGNGLTREADFHPELGLVEAIRLETASGALVEDTTLALEPDEQVGGVLFDARTQSFGALAKTTREVVRLSAPGAGLPSPRVTGWSEDPGEIDLLYQHDELSNTEVVGPLDLPVMNAERNRVLRLDRWGGGVEHAYAYDESGRVVQRDAETLDWDAGGRIARVGSRASFVWDSAGRPVEQTLEGVTERARWGGAVWTDAGGTPKRVELRDATLLLDTGERRYQHDDYRGNLKLVTDDAGAVRTHVHYEPYRVHRVYGDAPRRSFAHGLDLGDLVVLGPRVYDGRLGRFLAPDPIAHPLNDFAYAMGNPVLYWDPTGLDARSVVLAVLDSIDFEATGSEVGSVIGSSVGATLGASVGGPSVFGTVVGGALGGAAGHFGGKAGGAAIGREIDRAVDDALGKGDPPAPGGPGSPEGSSARGVSPRSGAAGRHKGCVGACPGPARWHGPGGRSGSPGTPVVSSSPSGVSCAGSPLAASRAPDAWIAWLLPLGVVVGVRRGIDARSRRGRASCRGRR